MTSITSVAQHCLPLSASRPLPVGESGNAIASAIEIFRLMRANPPPMNEEMFRHAQEREAARRALVDFEYMLNCGVIPTLESVNAFLKLYACTGYSNTAGEYLRQFQIWGLTPNLETFTALIHTCVYGKDLTEAFEYFNCMVQYTKPSAAIFDSILQICVDTQDREAARICRQTMRDYQIVPTRHMRELLRQLGL